MVVTQVSARVVLKLCQRSAGRNLVSHSGLSWGQMCGRRFVKIEGLLLPVEFPVRTAVEKTKKKRLGKKRVAGLVLSR